MTKHDRMATPSEKQQKGHYLYRNIWFSIKTWFITQKIYHYNCIEYSCELL